LIAGIGRMVGFGYVVYIGEASRSNYIVAVAKVRGRVMAKEWRWVRLLDRRTSMSGTPVARAPVARTKASLRESALLQHGGLDARSNIINVLEQGE